MGSPPSPSRSRRAAWTLALSLAASLSSALAALITTPILLQYLGDERVGAYRVATEWTGYLALLDFGITGALQVAFARALGTGNRVGVVGAVRAGIRAGLVLAVLSTLCGLGLAIAAPYMLRGMSADTAVELRQGLLVALVGFIWVPLIAFRPLAEAGQRGYVVQAALIAQTWLTTGLVIGLAIAGAGLLGQFLAVALGNGVTAILLLWDALRRYPGIVSQTASVAALPVAFSGSMFAFNLLSRIGLHSDSIIVGLTLGPGAVVAFSVTQRLILLANTQVLALGSATWVVLAEMHHQGQTERFNHRLTQLTRLTGVFAFLLLVPVAAATESFVGLWVGIERFGGGLLILATAAFVWIHTLSALWGWPLITTGRVRSILPIYFLGIPLNVAVSIFGSLWIGVAGPALGSAMSLAALWFWWLPWILRREFGTPLRPLARAVAAPAAIGIPLCVGLYLLAALFPIHELPIPLWGRWCVLVGSMAVAATVYFILAWFFVLPREDRNELRARLRLG